MLFWQHSSLLCFTPGLPAGVCNIVYGTGPRAGEAIVKHPSVPLISFTGSTAVGRRIQSVSAPYVKKLSLEVCVYVWMDCVNTFSSMYWWAN